MSLVFHRASLVAGAIAALGLAGCSGAGISGISGASIDGGPPGSDDAGSPLLVVSATSVSFGSFTVGASSAPTNILVTNAGTASTGAPSVSMGGANAASFAIDADSCTGRVLPPDGSCAVTIHFAPTAAGADDGTLTIIAWPGGSIAIPLGGTATTPGDVLVAPQTNDFGPVLIGATSTSQAFTVTNTGDGPTGSLATTLGGSDAAQFAITDDGCAVPSLAAGQTCTVNVAFAPSALGARSASLTVSGAPGGTANASLTGAAVSPGALTVTGTTTAFAPIVVNTTSTLSFSVNNTGGSDTGAVTLAISGANTFDFSISSTTCGPALAAGTSCVVEVVFTPTTTGAKSVTLSAMAGPGGIAGLPLTGSAVAQAFIVPNLGGGEWNALVGTQTADTIVTYTNQGGVASGPLSVAVTNDPSQGGFVIDPAQTTCTTSPLAAGASCDVAIAFAPASATNYASTLALTATPGSDGYIELEGTGIAPATFLISPNPFSFAATTVGQTSASETFTVQNIGGEWPDDGLSVSLSGAGASQFTIVSKPCDGIPLGPTYTCDVTIAFEPTVSGPASATLSVSADPSIPVASSSLSGVGQ